MIDSARFGSWRGLGGREHSRAPSERLFANLRKNVNVEPSGHRNARYDKKRGPCLRTLFGRRALRVAIATEERERGGAEIESKRGHVPAIREHDDVAAHLSKEDLAQWDAMPVIPTVSVEHEHRWPRGRKLMVISSAPPPQNQNPKSI